MRRLSQTSLIAFLSCLVLLTVGQPSVAGVPEAVPAAASGPWAGKATNLDGTFNYGAVRFTVRGDSVRNFVIEGVTTDCGYMSLAMNTMRIKGNRLSGAYQPVKDIDQIIVVNATFTGRTITGTFTSGPLCGAEGAFTARAK